MRLVPSKVFNPRDHVEADTYVNTDAYAGAFHDIECRTTSELNFESPIYFQPALVQSREICRPDLDDDDVENIVGIPIIKKRRLHWNSTAREYKNHYSLEVNLYRPKPTLELGGQYENAIPGENPNEIILGLDDDVNVGDTIFVYPNNKLTFEVQDVNYIDDDLKKVTLDRNRDIAEIEYAGWLMPSDNPKDDVETLLSQIISKESLQSPTFGGICGPLQPMTVDSVLLHFMVLISGKAKLIVDDEFFDHPWLSGEEIEMRLLSTDNTDTDDQGVLDTYTVRYRSLDHPDDNVVWRCTLGNFIIEADQPYENAAYITVNAPNHGHLSTSV